MKFEYKNLKIAKDVIFKSKNDPTINVGNPVEFEKALNELGGKVIDIITKDLDPETNRQLIVIQKTKPIPTKYPRNKNLPRTNPL